MVLNLKHMSIAIAALLAIQVPVLAGDALAIRVGRAETIANGTVEHAVILVENGRITMVEQDLPIERGIPILDRPEWTAMPGLVLAYTRAGLGGGSASMFEPQRSAAKELYPASSIWETLRESGITTVGLFPTGTGVPGQAVALRPMGKTPAEMILSESAFLKVTLTSDASAKKRLRDGFEEADEHVEKEQKAREKWEKDQEKKKKKKSSKKKDDDEKDDDKEEKDDEPKVFVAPEPDEKVTPFLRWRAGELHAVIAIRKAADYLHLLDVLSDEDVKFDLRLPMRSETDIYEVADKLAEQGCRVVLEPRTAWHPGSRQDRNVARELSEAGVEVVLIPQYDSTSSFERWLSDVGFIVKMGLDREAALRGVTLAAAGMLGLGDRLGSIEAGKDANLLFFDGDPLEPTSNLEAVMLEGEFVSGEVDL